MDMRRIAGALSRRRLLGASAGMLGCSLPAWLGMRQAAAADGDSPRARNCIVVYCWGGMSHHETFDLKPDASAEVRGEFEPIATNVPGIQVGEHLPRLAGQMDKLAVIRSIHHNQSAHGRGMYWTMTGHEPPAAPAGNIAPERHHWPSLAAMISKFRQPQPGVPGAVRLPYPLVDNGTLQAGEYGGWLGVEYDPIVMKTPRGEAWGGVSRSLGAEVLELGGKVDVDRVASRNRLLHEFDRPPGHADDFRRHDHFQQLASDLLLSEKVKRAYDLANEAPKVAAMYGEHIGGQSLLLSRRMVEAGVPVVQVCFAAGDLNGGSGDMWDTHGDNFNRLKKRLLPVLDQGLSALLMDLEQRGMLDETLVVLATDFGRTPKINGGAGRDHYPNVYSVALAGGGIRGGQLYGSSDGNGAYPDADGCSPADLHATVFHALGISPRAQIHDNLDRPFPLCDGRVLPLS